MREHLYQGRQLDNGEWVEGSYVRAHKWFGDGKAGHFIYDIYGENRVLVDPDTVSEFTGLTDKNGTKIFEGHIVKWVGNGKTFIDEVIFAVGQFKAGDFPLFMVTLCNAEVIGNKWDNPELLKGGAE